MYIFIYYAILSSDISNFDLFLTDNSCLIRIFKYFDLCYDSIQIQQQEDTLINNIIACNANDSILIKW